MKCNLKRVLSILFSATIIISVVINTSVIAGAATGVMADATQIDVKKNISINSTDVTIYAIEDWSAKYISIPSNFNSSFQLIVSGANQISYYVDGYEKVNISSNGLITPKINTYYWYGNYGTTVEEPNKKPTKITKNIEYGESTIIVCADDVEFEVKVNVVDYSDVYAEKIMDDYVSENIKNNMSTYEKINTIAKFVAERDYDDGYSSYAGLIIAGGGDCWASTDAIIYMSKSAGLQAWKRNGSKDYGAGSGHINAMVSDGKEYYEVEAGFTGSAPRYYSVKVRNSLYSYRLDDFDGMQIYQYDGEMYPSVLEIPSEINGNKVTSIGTYFAQSHPLIEGNSNINSVILPETVKKIGDRAFFACENLASITIPKSVLSIGNKALGYLSDTYKIEGFIICGYKNTASEEYANNNGFEYIALDENGISSGDVNGDGEIKAKDRMMLTRYLAKWLSYENINMTSADVNKDGEVNAKDRMILTRHLAKWNGYISLPYTG